MSTLTQLLAIGDPSTVQQLLTRARVGPSHFTFDRIVPAVEDNACLARWGVPLEPHGRDEPPETATLPDGRASAHWALIAGGDPLPIL